MRKFAFWNKNRKAKFVLKRSDNGKVYFIFRSSNGNIICTSQMYAQKSGAINGLTSMRDAILGDGKDIKIVDES